MIFVPYKVNKLCRGQKLKKSSWWPWIGHHPVTRMLKSPSMALDSGQSMARMTVIEKMSPTKALLPKHFYRNSR